MFWIKVLFLQANGWGGLYLLILEFSQVASPIFETQTILLNNSKIMG